MAQKKSSNAGIIAAATATAAAGVAAAAGYYFYASKNAKQHRKIASKWAGDFKKEVVKQAKKVKDLDQKAVIAAVESASEKFSQVRSAVDKKDLARAAKELRANWKSIVEELSSTAKGAKKSAKKAVASAKKSAKKAVSKAKKAVK